MISLVVALPLILLSIESAVASHFLYTAQDPVRTGSTPPKINFVFHYRRSDSLLLHDLRRPNDGLRATIAQPSANRRAINVAAGTGHHLNRPTSPAYQRMSR